MSKKLIEMFKMGKTEEKKFNFVGYNIEQEEGGIQFSQQAYADNLEVFDVSPASRSRNQDEDLTEEAKSLLRNARGR